MRKYIFTLLVALFTSAAVAQAETEHIDLLQVFTGKVSLIQRPGTPDRYGWENVTMMEEDVSDNRKVVFARINFPKGSHSPGVMIQEKKPVGGCGFRIRFQRLQPSDKLSVVYYVRFPSNFPFVKGGKLPGLGGGAGNTGGNKPNGLDGFSARLMWRTNGAGEAYTYLPNGQPWGTSLGRGKWTFPRGVWVKVEQQIALNTPGQNDGWIGLLVNDKVVHVQEGLRFRDVDTLLLDQVIFETFFGGNDPSWAPPYDTYLDIAEMAIVK